MKTRTKYFGMLAATATVATLATAGPAMAAQSTQPFTCDGQQLVIRTNNNHSSDNGGWSAAIVVDGGSGALAPTSFTFAAYDETTGQPIFEGTQLKGGGNANHNQRMVTCTQTTTDTLGDLLEPGDELPPGAALSDVVQVTVMVVAVPHS